jgi:hypothetical protein
MNIMPATQHNIVHIPVPTLHWHCLEKPDKREITFVVVLADGRVTLMQDVIFHPTV